MDSKFGVNEHLRRKKAPQESKNTPKNEEVIQLFSEWTIKAVISCLRQDETRLDLSDNSQFMKSLSECISSISQELLVYYDEYRAELD